MMRAYVGGERAFISARMGRRKKGIERGRAKGSSLLPSFARGQKEESTEKPGWLASWLRYSSYVCLVVKYYAAWEERCEGNAMRKEGKWGRSSGSSFSFSSYSWYWQLALLVSGQAGRASKQGLLKRNCGSEPN